jgi:hypothetical protein
MFVPKFGRVVTINADDERMYREQGGLLEHELAPAAAVPDAPNPSELVTITPTPDVAETPTISAPELVLDTPAADAPVMETPVSDTPTPDVAETPSPAATTSRPSRATRSH